jgi:hypothetical protein
MGSLNQEAMFSERWLWDSAATETWIVLPSLGGDNKLRDQEKISAER